MRKAKEKNKISLKEFMPVIAIGFFMTMVLFLSGCGEQVLHADFNNYDSGTTPSGDILGQPDGDKIALGAACPLVQVRNTPESIGSPDKGLDIEECTVEFIPADHDLPDQYFISWKGSGTAIIKFSTFGLQHPSYFTLNTQNMVLDAKNLLQNIEPIDFLVLSPAHYIRLEFNTSGLLKIFIQEIYDGFIGPLHTGKVRGWQQEKIRSISVGPGPGNSPQVKYHLSDLKVYAK